MTLPSGENRQEPRDVPTASGDTPAESRDFDAADARIQYEWSLRNARAPRPVLGPGICIFGSLLWAYVVAGEFTTAGIIGEWPALLTVVLVTSVTWYMAVRLSLAVRLGRFGMLGRTLAPMAFAVLSALLIAIAMAILGESRGHDMAVTLCCLALGAGAFIGGLRLTVVGRFKQLWGRLGLAVASCAVIVSIATIVHVVVAN